jgi:hypothetical protein
MCFVWIPAQTAIISLYRINWLVFITETDWAIVACEYGPLRNRSFCFVFKDNKIDRYWISCSISAGSTAQWMSLHFYECTLFKRETVPKFSFSIMKNNSKSSSVVAYLNTAISGITQTFSPSCKLCSYHSCRFIFLSVSVTSAAIICEIWDYDSGVAKLLGCDATSLGEWFPTFQECFSLK